MADIKDFDKPIGTWVEESTPVKSLEFNPETKSISIQEKVASTKTMYIHAPKEKIRCKNGEHVFRVIDTSKYLFQCIKCPFIRKVYPTTYRFEVTDKEHQTGILVHKVTGVTI